MGLGRAGAAEGAASAPGSRSPAPTSLASWRGCTEDSLTSVPKYQPETAKQAPIPQIPAIFFSL